MHELAQLHKFQFFFTWTNGYAYLMNMNLRIMIMNLVMFYEIDELCLNEPIICE